MPKAVPRTHTFHAEAKIFEGSLRLPLVQQIQPQAHAQLPSEGGYKSQHSAGFRLEGVLSYGAAHSQVAGNPGTKTGHGWQTLSTTVIENLNVLEVLTADRVVAQIITEHPLVGYVPTVSFLGTRFENLRIAGHPVQLDLDTGILGPKPVKDGAYTKDSGLKSRVSSQYDRILKAKNLPKDLHDRYNQLSSTLGSPEAVECSLVNQAAGPYPGHSFGHVVVIPDFGVVTLAKLTVTHTDFVAKTGTPKKTTVTLTMIDLKLGCAIDGSGSFASGGINGGGFP
jgi:hypothetical protein